MRPITRKTLSLLALFVAILGQAQVKKGDVFFDQFEYGLALEAYEWAYHEKHVQNPFLTRKIALSHYMLGNMKEAKDWYERTLHRDQTNPLDMLHFAEALKYDKDYSEAMRWYKRYNEAIPDDRRAVHHLENENYVSELLQDSAFYELKRLGMNTGKPEFGICKTHEGYLYSAVGVVNPELGSKYHKGEKESSLYMDVYLCTRDAENELEFVREMGEAVNSTFHDGPVAWNPQNKDLYITRNNERKGKPVIDSQGKVNLKIYRSAWNGSNYDKAVEFPFNSEEFSNAHPNVSPDGQQLFFASNRPGGEGQTDIYVCTWKGTAWGEPQNIGRAINTEGKESFPYMAEDGNLYFASTGHAGLGGLDLFKTSFRNGYWTKPENLGNPINSHRDDFGLLLDADGNSGYFSSNRFSQSIDDDIFYFKYDLYMDVLVQIEDEGSLKGLDNAIVQIMDQDGHLIVQTQSDADGYANLRFIPESCRYKLVIGKGKEYSQQVLDIDHCTRRLKVYDMGKVSIGQLTYMALGTIKRRSDQEPMAGFRATLYNASTGEEIRHLETKKDGKVQFNLDWETDYKLTLFKEGWFAKSAAFTTKGMDPGIIEIERYVDLAFEEIVLEKAIKIENIHYDFNKFTIRDDAKPELDKIVKMMLDNPTVKIELSSHTDSRGGDKYNLVLSDSRAKAAAKYIVENGVASNRIHGKGYGENTPVNGCSNGVDCSEDEHQANRRTEFKVLDY